MIEIAREDAVQGIYRIVREKQGSVVYRQCALQTVTSLRVVSLVFRGHDLLKITNINPQRSSSSIMPDFRDGKTRFFERERRKWNLGLAQHLKRPWPKVRAESKVAGK